MSHQEFVDLTKKEKRQLPHTNYIKLNYEGQPTLTVGYWQSQFKVKDHGAIHELEYTLKKNGATKTEDNTLKFMRSVADMPNQKNVKWFDDGTYLGGTDREFPAVHIYDLDKQIIAVFKKSTGKFVSSCQLADPEHDKLMETGNFGGGAGWFSGQVKNLPPITPVNSFENDVMGITLIDNSQVENP